MSRNRKKVFVGMSGGVDSSVAAFLLKKQGYDVVGVFMRCYNLDGCAEQDALDARRVAEHIGIPFYVWDFEDDYKKRVVEYMVEGYRAGITPNPDVMCNREIKFGLFFEKALRMGADYIATGHYVRLDPKFPISNSQFLNKRKEHFKNSKINNSLKIINYKLKIAQDLNKDQSYFLWTLTQKQLVHCLFPIGEYQKSKVREIARKAGLPTAEKKDSQGICFLGKVTLADFLAAYIPEHPGKVLTASGKEIGMHRGAEFYTIGQRHIGVNFQFPISNFQKGERKPFYIAEKNIKTNSIIVAEGQDDMLYRKEIALHSVNFINPEFKIENLQLKIPVFARIRYRQPLSAAELITYDKKLITKKDKQSKVISHWSLVFDKPQKFVAAGQSAVFYSKTGQMLGGGVIV